MVLCMSCSIQLLFVISLLSKRCMCVFLFSLHSFIQLSIYFFLCNYFIVFDLLFQFCLFSAAIKLDFFLESLLAFDRKRVAVYPVTIHKRNSLYILGHTATLQALTHAIQHDSDTVFFVKYRLTCRS